MILDLVCVFWLYCQLPFTTPSRFFLGKKKTEKSKKGINQTSSPEKQIKYAGHFICMKKQAMNDKVWYAKKMNAPEGQYCSAQYGTEGKSLMLQCCT